MSVRFDNTFVCPVFVGRDGALAAMRSLLDDARAGTSRTILVSGEAGVGKSRLVLSLDETARSLGALTVAGRCFETDRSFPFAVVRDLLQGFAGSHPAAVVAHFIGASAADLAELVPAVRATVSTDQTGAPSAEFAKLTRPERKRRLHQAVIGWLDRLARAQPLLVVLEDLHWSDDAALELILALARRVASERILLVLTFRSDEVNDDLARMISALDRDRLAADVELEPLTRDEVGSMLCATLATDPPIAPGLLDAIHRLTEGNPFFVEEVLRAMAAAGELTPGRMPRNGASRVETRIPRTVREAVGRRLRKLSPETQGMLAYAAVAGRRFDFELLRRVLRLQETELLPLVREAVAAQLVVEETADRFGFRHALTREALYADLLSRERRSLHAEVAEALEGLHAGSAILDADLGHHLFEAGDWARALGHCRRAGERAAALPAPREAVVHFSQALDAAAQLGIGPDGAVLRARGLARETIGDFDGALSDLEAALQAARETRDRWFEWQVLLDVGALWGARDYDRTGESFALALEIARGLEDAPALARTLNRVGNWCLNRGRSEEADRYYREALELFRGTDDRLGLAITLDLMALHALTIAQPARAARQFGEAIAHFRTLGEQRRLASSLAMRVSSGPGWFSGAFAPLDLEGSQGRKDAQESLDLARGIDWRAGEAYALCVRSVWHGWRGEYDVALADAREALALAEDIEHRQWTCLASLVLGRLYLDLLYLDEARAWLERALALSRELRSGIWVGWAGEFLALTLTDQGKPEEASALLDELIPEGPATFLPDRGMLLARAVVDLARGEPAQALSRARELIASASEPGRKVARSAVPVLSLIEGQALTDIGELHQAEAALKEGRAGAAAQRSRPLIWRCDVALGRLYARARRRARATAVFASARSTIDALAGEISDPSLRDVFSAAANGLMPAPRPPTRRHAAKEAFGGLTAREREVAGLVALGQSNRAISRALGLSVRTVESHVSRALGRLGFTSRAQLAAWAERHGLSEDPTRRTPASTGR